MECPRTPFRVLDANTGQAASKKRRLAACARATFSLDHDQLAAMMGALGPQSKASMQAILDSHGGSHAAKNPCKVPADIWSEAFGNLVASASDGAAASIVVDTLRRELCLQTEARRDAEIKLRRVSVVWIGSRTMATQTAADDDFSPTAIAALCDNTAEAWASVYLERDSARKTRCACARATERERERPRPGANADLSCVVRARVKSGLFSRENESLSRERESLERTRDKLRELRHTLSTHMLSTHSREGAR